MSLEGLLELAGVPGLLAGAEPGLPPAAELVMLALDGLRAARLCEF